MTPEQRHRCMAAIKGKDTKPELIVRKYLFSRGLRFRIQVRKLPGRPDIVLRKYRTVIFVDGCFWHGHEGCRYFRLPKSNVDFWRAKIERDAFLRHLYHTITKPAVPDMPPISETITTSIRPYTSDPDSETTTIAAEPEVPMVTVISAFPTAR